MTSDEMSKQEMPPVHEEHKEGIERTGTEPEAIVEETTKATHARQSHELNQLFGKKDEESEGMRDGSDASQGSNGITRVSSAPLPIPADPPANHRRDTRGAVRHAQRRRVVVSIAVAMVVLLFALGGIGAWFNRMAPVRPAIGTLLYTFHIGTGKRGIYVTFVNSIGWSPDGDYLVCATGDKALHVLKLTARAEVLVYRGHRGWVNDAVWFPDGKRVASASSDHTVQIWDAATGKTISTFTSSSSVWAVAIPYDGNLIAFAGRDGIVQVWRVDPQIHLYTYTGQVRAGGIWGLAFSPDGKRLASGDSSGVIQLWDVTSGGHVLTYRGHTDQIYDLKWSPDGRWLASASQDGTVQVWNASSGRTIYIHRFSSAPMQAVSWSPDGKRIASASANGTVQIWDAFDGGHLFVYRHHSGRVFTVAWSPDGSRIASGDESGSIQVWQAR